MDNQNEYGKCRYLLPENIVNIAEEGSAKIYRPKPQYLLKSIGDMSFFDVSHLLLKTYNPNNKVLRLEPVAFNPSIFNAYALYSEYIDKYLLADDVYATKFYEGYKDEYFAGIAGIKEILDPALLLSSDNGIDVDYVVADKDIETLLKNILTGFSLSAKDDEIKPVPFSERFMETDKKEAKKIRKSILPNEAAYVLRQKDARHYQKSDML